jgi:molybdate transport system permease protein
MAWQPLLLSFHIAALAIGFATAIGVALGLLLATKRFIGRDVLDAFSAAPMVMPPTVLGYYVLVALGRNSIMGRAWEAATGSQIVFTRTGAVIAATVTSTPLIVKAARAALEDVDSTLLRAARTLGAGPVRAFFNVHLPLAANGIISGVMLGFARALGEFGVTLMVAGDIPGETQTASLAIYDIIQAHEDQQATGMVIVLTGIAIATLYVVNKLTRRRHAD